MTMDIGGLCNFRILATNASATVMAENMAGKGMKWAYLESLSTTVMIVVLPRDGERQVIKSIVISSNTCSRIDNG